MKPAVVCRSEFLELVVESRVIIVRRDKHPKKCPFTLLSFNDDGVACALTSSDTANTARFGSEEKLVRALADLGLNEIMLPVRSGQSVTYLTRRQRDIVQRSLA